MASNYIVLKFMLFTFTARVSVLMEGQTIALKAIYYKKLIHKNVIYQVISYWPRYTSDVSCIGPSAKTANFGPVPGAIQKHLIDTIIHVFIIHVTMCMCILYFRLNAQGGVTVG